MGTPVLYTVVPFYNVEKNKGYLQTIHFKNLNDPFTTRKEYIYTS